MRGERRRDERACFSSRGAIEEGKAIFHNIRNFVRFQLSTCVHVRFEADDANLFVLLPKEYCRLELDHALDRVSLSQSVERHANPLDQYHHGWTTCSEVTRLLRREESVDGGEFQSRRRASRS